VSDQNNPAHQQGSPPRTLHQTNIRFRLKQNYSQTLQSCIQNSITHLFQRHKLQQNMIVPYHSSQHCLSPHYYIFTSWQLCICIKEINHGLWCLRSGSRKQGQQTLVLQQKTNRLAWTGHVSKSLEFKRITILSASAKFNRQDNINSEKIISFLFDLNMENHKSTYQQHEKVAKMTLERLTPWLWWHSGGWQVGPFVSMNVGPMSNLQTTDVSSPIFATISWLRSYLFWNITQPRM